MNHESLAKMDVVLIILAAVGLTAVAVSAYVFTVAARNYVSADEHRRIVTWAAARERKRRVIRSPTDRRRGQPVVFPITVNGIVVATDRRSGDERRQACP